VSLPDGLILADEMARRQARLAHLAQAPAVGEARAPERSQAERPEDEANLRAREEQAPTRNPRGPPPKPPPPGPRARDQDHCTAPASRLMKHSNHDGCDPHDKAPIATDHTSGLVVAPSWSNPANEQAAVEPPLEALPEAWGTPPAGALDPGSLSAANRSAVAQRGLDPSSAVGREPPPQHWAVSCAPPLVPPPEAARPLVKRAYQRRTASGQAIDRLRHCTVEPVSGLIKDVLGFRQFSRRGLTAAAGAWCLGGLAFHRKRLHGLLAD
jgi:hypothetical protein